MLTILLFLIAAPIVWLIIEVSFIRSIGAPADVELRRDPSGATRVAVRPHDPRSQPYLSRWYIIRSRWLCLYLHRIDSSDDDRAMHDHRSWTISLLLEGEYDEITIEPGAMRRWRRMRDKYPHILACHSTAGWAQVRYRRRPWLPVFRRADRPHRLEVVRGPVWSLFLTGPDVLGLGRRWGFHGKRGWVHWRDWEQHGPDAEPTRPEPVAEIQK